MRLGICFLIALMLASVLTEAASASIELTFSGLQQDEAVENFYDGAFGGLGSGTGPNYGIIFSNNSLALKISP